MASQQEANLTTPDVIGTERVKTRSERMEQHKKKCERLCSIFGMVNTKMD